MTYLMSMLALAAVYLALTANFQLSNIIAGLLIAAAVLWLVPLKRQPVDLHRLPASAVAVVRYFFVLMADLMLSGIQVARIVLDPKLPIDPGIVAIPSHAEDDMGVALSSHAISLTPGELVVEIDDNGVMYTHCLDAGASEEAINRAQKMREDLLCKIFE